MQRRHFFHTGTAALALLGGLTAARTMAAEVADPDVVGAPKIIEALTPKDIVLDRPGQPARRQPPTGRNPAINLQVQFTFDSAQLMPQGKRQLDELAMALSHEKLLNAGFELAGHTDQVGDADYNLKLSHARAQAVKAYLAEAHGVSPQRLQTIGYGYSRLLDTAHPKAAINRRVEVRRLAAVQQMPAVPPSGVRLVPTPQ